MVDFHVRAFFRLGKSMSASIRETLGLEQPAAATEVKKAKKRKRMPTIRLTLTLGQPTADTFPEFSYARLVEKELELHAPLQSYKSA